MRNELTKFNIDKSMKILEDIAGKSIMIGKISLYSVVSIDIEENTAYDGDPIPEENYDGGKHDYINLRFKFENGEAAHSFCPDVEVCHFWHETDDLLIFEIQTIPVYVEKEKFDLDFRLEQYRKFTEGSGVS